MQVLVSTQVLAAAIYGHTNGHFRKARKT